MSKREWLVLVFIDLLVLTRLLSERLALGCAGGVEVTNSFRSRVLTGPDHFVRLQPAEYNALQYLPLSGRLRTM